MKSILFSVGLALCCVHVIAEDVTIWNDKSISGKNNKKYRYMLILMILY